MASVQCISAVTSVQCITQWHQCSAFSVASVQCTTQWHQCSASVQCISAVASLQCITGDFPRGAACTSGAIEVRASGNVYGKAYAVTYNLRQSKIAVTRLVIHGNQCDMVIPMVIHCKECGNEWQCVFTRFRFGQLRSFFFVTYYTRVFFQRYTADSLLIIIIIVIVRVNMNGMCCGNATVTRVPSSLVQ